MVAIGALQRHRRRRQGSSRSASPTAPARPAAYYLVAGVNLCGEMRRLRALPLFAGGRLAGEPPALKVRRSKRRPNRLGFAVPAEWRVSVTAYPGIRTGDIQETLLHELVHLHVGIAPGHRRWHGREFKDALSLAMKQGYGISGLRPRNSLHGAYAEAIERRRRHAALGEARTDAARAHHPDQLHLPLAS